jgi:V/A-type H+-transporting ATPase subunit I
MLVKMKKLTLLVSEAEREKLLLKLRRLGTVHVQNLTKPQGLHIRPLEDTISHVKKAISILAGYRVTGSDKVNWEIQEVPGKAKEVVSIAGEKDEAAKNLEYVKSQIGWYKMWGSFDPEDLKKLKGKGVFITLYRAGKKTFKKISRKKNIHVINRDKQHVYLAQVSDKPDERLPLEEVTPAKHGFEELNARRDSLNIKLKEIEDLLGNMAGGRESLKNALPQLEKKHTFLNVIHGMKEEKKFSYLQGFCPKDKVKEVTALTKSYGAGYLMEEPDNPMETPTLIRNPKWVSIISPVFKFMNTVPGYKEYDISFWFLLFFSLFFAMLIGDAGYGLLFMVLALFARIKLKTIDKRIFFLIYTLSFATLIWGAITGTWFGAEGLAKLPFLNTLVVERIDSFVAGNQNFMIYVCFVIGAIHLSIAHLIKAFRIINTLKSLAETGWILILWGLFFTAGTLVLAKPFPAFGRYLLAAGTALVLLFSNPQKNVIKGMLVSLADIPLKIVSSFSDVVSYLRLFAVGYASLILANTFNNMAMQIGFNNVLSGIGSAFIMFFGHMLNIALGLMAVIVHGIRLNMLEFSGQMGMEWSGREYDPFREKQEA